MYTSLQTSMILQLSKTVCACSQIPRVFLFVVEMSKDHWRLTPAEICCQVSTWRSRLSRKMRLLHQLDLTIGLKKEPHQTLFCTERLNNVEFEILTFSCKTFSFKSVFCSCCIFHQKKASSELLQNIDFEFISAHLFEAFVKRSMGLCQGLPFRAHFQSCRNHLTMLV